MTETNSKPMGSEICTMQIAFPFSSDERMLMYKKKIKEAIAEIPHVRIDIHLMNMPVK
jgi:nicotinamide mononucleotide adenylyltransferase